MCFVAIQLKFVNLINHRVFKKLSIKKIIAINKPNRINNDLIEKLKFETENKLTEEKFEHETLLKFWEIKKLLKTREEIIIYINA